MGYIWENKDWPHFVINRTSVQESVKLTSEEEFKTKSAFSILREETSINIKANLIAEGIKSSLLIESESIDIDSVFSSVAKHLAIKNYVNGKQSPYSENLVEMISDAYENKDDITTERINSWQKKLFMNQSGLVKKTNPGFRKGPEYVMKASGKNNDIVYEAVPFDRIGDEMLVLLDYINKSDDNMYIKAAVASLWFVLIHPFEDGNGRISRAIADYILMRNTEEKLPILCLSAGILRKRKEYYSQIESLSSQSESLDITEYIAWFLDVISDCYRYSRDQLSKTVSISALIGSLDSSEFNSRELKMLYLFASSTFKGKITNEKWKTITKCSSTVAFRDIQHLVKSGFLIPSGESGPKAGYYFDETKLYL